MGPRVEYPVRVFYDASCPMCASELHALKRRDREGRLELVDCSAPEFDASPDRDESVSRAALMARIHARDASGRWLVGLDAFAVVYQVAGLTALARIWSDPLWRPVLDPFYAWVARNRQLLSRLGMNRLVRLLLGTR